MLLAGESNVSDLPAKPVSNEYARALTITLIHLFADNVAEVHQLNSQGQHDEASRAIERRNRKILELCTDALALMQNAVDTMRRLHVELLARVPLSPATPWAAMPDESTIFVVLPPTENPKP